MVSNVSGPGYLISLARDDAKRLFALNGDEPVRAFALELVSNKKYRENELVLDLGKIWDPIHRCLTEGRLDPDGGEYPLNQCILGGRQLYKGKDFIVALVRPDVTPYVAEALAKLKREEFSANYFKLDPADYGCTPSEQELTQIWIIFRRVRDFFADAAEERNAVLFVGQP